MNTRNTVVAIVLSSVIFAAAGWILASLQTKTLAAHSPKHAHKYKDCRSTACDANNPINIYSGCDDDNNPTADTCEPFAEQEIVITKTGMTQIVFAVGTNGYKFDSSDGIKFTSDNSGNQVFTCTSDNPRKNERCVISNSQPTTLYKYLIHIKKGNVDLNTTDPWVVNY
jgi:hypothetical protein